MSLKREEGFVPISFTTKQRDSLIQKILISACLLGDPVRYDGDTSLLEDGLISQWRREKRLVKLCPEMAGGLSTPRLPAEIVGGDGHHVLAGNARVLTVRGDSVGPAFVRGAEAALALAQQNGIRFALLKSNSPSCGNWQIYSGEFNGRKQAGQGVTAALLAQNGVQVFNETEVLALAQALKG